MQHIHTRTLRETHKMWQHTGAWRLANILRLPHETSSSCAFCFDPHTTATATYTKYCACHMEVEVHFYMRAKRDIELCRTRRPPCELSFKLCPYPDCKKNYYCNVDTHCFGEATNKNMQPRNHGKHLYAAGTFRPPPHEGSAVSC